MLSIIIPTFNEKKSLSLLLDSIKRQNFVDYEIIVSDAGSGDGTLDFIKEQKLKAVFTNSSDFFPAKQRNEGAKEARGDPLLFLDSDCILQKSDFLKKTLAEFSERKLDVAGFKLYPYGKKKFFRFLYDLFYNWYPALFFKNLLPHASNAVLVKREVHLKLKGFDEGIRIAEDHAYAREAAKIGRFDILYNSSLYALTKRFECDGWIKTSFKYLLCELHMILRGPVKSDFFRYKFGHFYKEKKSARLKKIFSFVFWWTAGFLSLCFLWLASFLVMAGFYFKRKLIRI